MAERAVIVQAALGHDVLEDTKATEREVRMIFGDRGFAIIVGMTNRWGDAVHAPYVRQIARSEEVVRLVKLSDLVDNIASVLHTFPLLGEKWTRGYFFPIVRPMLRALEKTSFVTYRTSAVELMHTARYALTNLEIEMREAAIVSRRKR